ncbi:alaS [Wigglesworthia glossinidia endosymbiont of Glossina brevipalpis]|uniref:Alanine--tRNA ligase n=1 Tax=Wigglesworthia glossinidia brevipalpis TaxID=36870 RepID=SYA_WIGBR|nr:RecName: Full=Alanine--tRNA ligase; AltName: Full=Alanyl-tRNA synthetase; Short=AlaRS [Wigglesworthia glossinidia endosymbiont of Glossina brevipalpis]BAC24380.1 alaS [Wigglesworthia glossinidia endosymbiont of Glossina brevipalpis]
MKKTTEIRNIFLNFFYEKKHKIMDSSTLIPDNDKTLLFTNSGMNQFKDIFLGFKKPKYIRVATAQRCIRVGGKHNDLNMIGKTNRHHTFFEMLGNFSFGSYFKSDTIQFAWELLTSKKWFDLSKEKLIVTIYYKDIESYNLWVEKTNINPKNIIFIKDKNNILYNSDNFWTMGDTGPCGPCSEIFYFFGKSINYKNIKIYDEEYIEIWNLVFMQFNLHLNGKLSRLPITSIDTGMGLERISCVLQKVNSNYSIDLFKKLIYEISKIIEIKNIKNYSLRIIADHIRSAIFLIYDGVIPSKEGRGYVLRRIIRRAIFHGNYILNKSCFFYKLVSPAINIMSYIDSKIIKKKKEIENIIKEEEKIFFFSIKKGMIFLNKNLKKIKNNILKGEIAFKLHDTFGFPIDLTNDICIKNKINVDEKGFFHAMNEQKNKSYKNSCFNKFNLKLLNNYCTKFCGYSYLKCESQILNIYNLKEEIKEIKENQEGIIILDKTPFYGESGGQVGDSGEIKSKDGVFSVIDTKKLGNYFYHYGKVIQGILKINNKITAYVNKIKRNKISLNHSSTHLLHYAINCLLDKNIIQKGSLICEKYLSFDFSYGKKINIEKINEIENIINEKIRDNVIIHSNNMDLKNALKIGAKALFKNKYKDLVRVLNIGDFSIELCGGTHANRTGDIGCFVITNFSKISSDTYRIKAITGETAIAFIQKKFNDINTISSLIKSNSNEIVNKIEKITENLKILEKKNKNLKNKIIKNYIKLIFNKIKKINNFEIIMDYFNEEIDKIILREILNKVKTNLKNGIVILASIKKDNLYIVTGVTNNLVNIITAKEIISYFKEIKSIKGGGNSYFAEAVGVVNLIDLKSMFKKIFMILSKNLK